MKLLERILLPLDFGPGSDCVVAAAIGVAKAFDSEVHLLYVLPKLDGASPDVQELIQMARQEAANRLAEVRVRLEHAGVHAMEGTVVAGTPFDQIARHSEEIDANVVIVGPRSAAGVEGRGSSTTTERLCRKSSKPVWIVNAGSGVGPESMLCPVDCSLPSRRALRNAIHLARRFDAKLFILHVVPPMAELLGIIPSVKQGMERKHVQSETSRFEGFLGEFDFHGVRYEKVVREGTPADSIIDSASEFAADLIIMGSVGRTGVSRILLGSVASKVVRNLPCSTVVVKAEDAIRLKLGEELADLKTHYARGCELLENAFLEEATRQFEQCIRIGGMFTPAWERLAETCERHGDAERAEDCRKTAREIEEMAAWRRVEADIRRDHPLWKKNNK